MKLVKNYLYNMSYNLLILFTPLLTVPYISRVLHPVGVGINATTNSVITYFLLFGTVGITIYGNREIAFIRDDFKKRSRVFWEIEFLQIFTISVAYLFFLMFLFFEKQYKIYFFYQSFLIIAGAFDISWYFMGLEDFKKTVSRNAVIKVLSVAATFLIVRTSHDVGKYILVLSISQLLGNLTLWPYLLGNVDKPTINFFAMFKHLKPSIMLFIPQIAMTVYLALNKTMLWKLDSVSASGFYDYSDKLIKLVLAVVTAIGTVMLPHIANLYAKKQLEKVKQYLYTSFDFVLFISISLGFGIAAISTTLAPWFFGRYFSSVNTLLMIESPVILFIGLSNVIGQQYLLPTKKTAQYTVSVVLGALVNIIVNIPLIIAWGVKGAMLATVISEFCVTAYQLFVVRHDFQMRHFFKNIISYLLSGSCMCMIVYTLNVTMKISVFSLLGQVVVGILTYIGLILIIQPDILNKVSDLSK
ncbi:oligosaccharide flippase family protein [Lactobacillus plantarum]|uniref:oligosaccharide flippase family protein n=1 Tax=Lactiplantibacillus plantarum TaxID=1590 RepID=UPI00143D902D|nr:polysaccharide biosynthesis C-terminal domain-containing protein [Lactiplantibacillus plantarum]MBE1726920.1 polysaccharide biosynthesis C-terminal domain-containing protein [Lactiplantibacillus plantarum]NKI38961.1 oligosaccharide flippase family protein [Lactiplantibacillus plantarum]